MHVPLYGIEDLVVPFADEKIYAMDLLCLPRFEDAEEQIQYLFESKVGNPTVSTRPMSKQIAVELEAVEGPQKTCLFCSGQAANFKRRVEVMKEESSTLQRQGPNEGPVEASYADKVIGTAFLQDIVGVSGT
jgi:hypothetical protein